MGNGRGYLDDHSRSVNAAEAEASCEFPASVCATKLRIPVEVVRRSPCATVGHHTSSWYNETMYYDLRRLRGWLLMGGGYAVLRQVRAEAAAAEAEPPSVVENCIVEWLEWSGSRRRPKVTQCRAEGATVTVKAETATVILPDGTSFRKRLRTKGFRYEAR